MQKLLSILIVVSIIIIPPGPVSLAEGIQYSYDANGNRLTMTDSTGTTYYIYDELNRLISITNPKGQTTTFSYDGLSRQKSMTLPNGLTTTYTYDVLSQLTALQNKLQSFTYTYDPVGNRTTMTDLSGTHNYAFDTLNRIVSALHPLPQLPTEDFGYDAVGNRISPGIYLYDSANRLLEDNEFTYSYDNIW